MELAPLDQETYEALKESIKRFGVLVPILRSARTGALLDGHHRVEIAKELHVSCPVRMVDIEEGDELPVAIAVNLARRHMAKAERLEVTRHLMELNTPERAIGGVTGVSPAQVHRDVQAVREDPGAPRGVTATKFDDEAKAQALARIDAGETIRAVAADIGAGESTVGDWRKKAKAPPAEPRPANVRRLRIPAQRALSEMAQMLDGIVTTLEYIDTKAADMDSLGEWVESVNRSLLVLTRFMKEFTRAPTNQQSTTEDHSNRSPEMGTDCGHEDQPANPA